MLASEAARHPDLSALVTLLNRLIGQTEAGDWEAVVAMQPEVCQQLADIQKYYESSAATRSPSGAERGKIAEIAALIAKAETNCATRREQIAPLVNSLKALPDSSRA